MPDLQLPSYRAGERPPIGSVLEGIIEHDQFDDWLPDPVYFEDYHHDQQALTDHLARAWQSRHLAFRAADRVDIPRDDGAGFTALFLPLGARATAHAVIGAMAPRIGSVLQRDKIHGFEFRANSVPMFTPPGEGFGEALDNAAAAALITDSPLRILDVVGFNRNARIDRLALILQSSGARPEESEVIRRLTSLGGPGLPSIDDAFAFVYNLYLSPVDEVLLSARANVFRYRDEYFLPGTRAQSIIEAEPRKLELAARIVAVLTHLDRKDGLKARTSPQKSVLEEIIGPVREGSLVAEYECDSWDGKICVTETYEVRFREKGLDAVAELVALSPVRSVDGVRVLPLLRAIHRRRKYGVSLQPPFSTATQEFRQYRRELQPARRWLASALAAAVESNREWEATWTAAVLSDLGPLTEAETQVLLHATRAPNLGETAKVQARLALARGSAAAPQAFWRLATDPSDYAFRAALLAASHLARRKVPGPWEELRARCGPLDVPLRDMLAAHIRNTPP